MNALKLVNLTGHDVVIFERPKGGEVATHATDVNQLKVLLRVAPKPGRPKHLEVASEPDIIEIDGVMIPSGTEWYTGTLQYIPDPEPGTLYIVSRLFASAAASSGRDDLVYPAEEVRKDGIVAGCFKLVRAKPFPTEWKVASQ
ncbi:MAG: hypothetical protein GX483_04865 [Actinomycetaceae bacterium]|nr:hypothetical protein [Actinomycetaceae bacterium]